VGVFAAPGQVVDGLLAVGRRLDGDARAAGAERLAQEQHVVLVVVGDEHDLAAHAPSAGGSSIQKREPRPGSESNSTRPPMRSTARETMARPTPVPGNL